MKRLSFFNKTGEFIARTHSFMIPYLSYIDRNYKFCVKYHNSVREFHFSNENSIITSSIRSKLKNEKKKL